MKTINAHIHLFDENGENIHYKHETCVGFADISKDFESIDYTTLYDKYINTHKINGCLLSCGKDAREMITIYKNHRDVIRGFGEIKIFKKDIHNFNREELKKLLDYNEMHENLPVMFHFDFINEENIQEVRTMLKCYPHTKFVHCHCGAPGTSTNEDMWAFTNSMILARELPNYYFDISWSIAKYIYRFKGLLKSAIVADKILLGTDTNVEMDKLLDDPDKEALVSMNIFNIFNNIFGDYNEFNCKLLFGI